MKKVAITLLFILVSLFLSGCVYSSANEATVEEYNQNVDLLNEDLDALSSLVDELNFTVETMTAGNYYIDEEMNEATVEEYNQNVDTLNEDLDALSSLVDEWNFAVETMPAGNYYTDEEINELSDIARRYSSECNFVIGHNSNFKIFIDTNGIVLKDLDVDTYSLEKSIADSEVQMSENCEVMVETVEIMAQHTESAEHEAM